MGLLDQLASELHEMEMARVMRDQYKASLDEVDEALGLTDRHYAPDPGERAKTIRNLSSVTSWGEIIDRLHGAISFVSRRTNCSHISVHPVGTRLIFLCRETPEKNPEYRLDIDASNLDEGVAKAVVAAMATEHP